VKDDLKALKVPENIMMIVPNGVDFYRLQDLEPSDEEFDIIYLGRLISHKNVDILLRTVSIVKKKIPDVRCGVMGDGPMMNELKALSNELDLVENVKFFGFIESDEKVYSHLKSSKVFFLPSIREGFPNTILEANSCGLPAIIVKHEKNAGVGVVKDGYNGYVLDLSAEDIAERIIFLLQNNNKLNELSKNSMEFAKDYDWNVVVRRIEEVYEEALKRC
ncbi:MAG: glycosyltransferase family 4 protein, partial [Thermotogota bacterium]|nr:glycosyltransferase family 4 protein [Thermotogota bacterium]